MNVPYHAPARASFLQKLGPGGAASLVLAVLTALGGVFVPLVFRLRQVLQGIAGDPPEMADLILVLGRRLEKNQPTSVFLARLAQAEALLRQGFAPRILVAGGTTGQATRSEAEAGRAWLLEHGVPEGALLVEDRSQHTLENLFDVRAQMRSEGWRNLLLVSDPLHLTRARATAEGLDLEVRCIPSTGDPLRPGGYGWWRRALHEAFLLHWYRIGMLYSRVIRSQRQLERVT